ncbi:cadherin-like domain-containing protein [Methylobacterium marchantiae]|uniref:Cadherin-like domain-containing protein n=1 Tax=Methylobacterium marchantiae TaxID=600331 RepID=A0ABW3X5R1_9HYPH|nr:hypothetical protein AIGOOFII_4278 [Methylobacterium marchantiae]
MAVYDPTMVSNDLVSGTEDTAYTVTKAQLLAGWSDPDGKELSVTGLMSSSGTVVANPDGSYTITPAANASGPVTLSYGVSDGLNTAQATRGFTLAAVNDAPELSGTQATLAVGMEDTVYTGQLSDLLVGFTDFDGETLSVSGLSADHGTVTINGGTFTLTPAQDHNGPVTLSYTVGDGTASTPASRTLTLTAVDDAPSFNAIGTGTGVVLTPVGTGGAVGQSVTVQADGKILVAGTDSASGSGSGADFTVVRYNIDGSLDTAFGTGGKVLTPVGPGASNDLSYSVTVQADGKIVVAGYSVGNGSSADFAVVRYNADGSLDTSFGPGKTGTIATPVGTGASNDYAYSATVQADGKILVAGNGIGARDNDFGVVRYNSDGSLDTTFGTGGKVLTPVGADSLLDAAYSITVQADGKIVAAGTAGDSRGNVFAVVRYNADGSLDTGFNGTGKVVSAIGGTAQSVTVQADGKIVVAGTSVGSGFARDFAVVRYTVDGSLDTTFGPDGTGTILTPVGAGASQDFGYSVTVQADGKIVVVGSGQGADGSSDFALVRYTADGRLDTGFGPNGTGKVLTPVGVGASYDEGRSVTVQADGKIVVVGQATGNRGQDFAVVRYNADGSRDTTFNAPSTLGGTAAYTENGAAVRLDTDVALSDVELDALNGGLGDYAGASLTLARQGGASAQDAFGFQPTGFTVSGHSLLDAHGNTFASFTNANGTLVVSFTGTGVATSALADAVARAVTYANTSDTPPASVALGWTFSEGGAGAQTVTGLTTIAVTPLIDVTAITATASRAGTLSAGDTVTFTLTTELLLTATGTPRLTLSNGASARFSGLDAASKATFTYTVATGQDTTDLTVIGVNLDDGSLNGPAKLGFAPATSVPIGSISFSVAPADLDGDGDLDLVASNFSSNTVSVCLGDGKGGFSGTTEVPVGSNPIGVALADINGDSNLDILVANYSSGSVSVRLGDGKGGFNGGTELPVGSRPYDVTLADVNGDGRLDLVASNSGSNSVSVRLGDGTGKFSGTADVPVGSTPFDVALADVNGDGKLDLVAANAGGNSVSVRLGDGKGGFNGTTEVPVSVGGTPYGVALADVDGDGDLDLVAANYNTNSVSVRLGDSKGGFNGTTEVPVGFSPTSVALADINGDSHLDILTANYGSSSVSVRLGDGKGGFNGTTELPVGSQVWGMTLADVNGDGRPDILTANNGASSVSVVLNKPVAGIGFDPTSVSGATPGATTNVAIDATAPVLTDPRASLTDGTEDTAYTVTNAQLLDGWSDAGSAILSVSGLTASSGTVTDNLDGTYTITPAADANGPVTLSYGVSDGLNTAQATRDFTLDAVNDAPDLSGTQATLAAGMEDTVYTGQLSDLLAGFTDIDGDTLSVTDLSADHGTVTIRGGTFTLTPDKDYAGPVTLSYSVSDGLKTAQATSNFALAAVNDAPELSGTQVTLAAGTEDTLYTGQLSDLLAGFTDIEGDTLAVTGLSADHGTVTIRGGTFTLTPDKDYAGPVTLRYGVSDGTAVTSTSRTLTLAAVNDAPVGTDDAIALVQRSSVAGDVLGNDLNPDGGTLSVISIRAVTSGATTTAVDGATVIAGRYGTFILQADGRYTYDADVEGRIAVGSSAVDDFLYTLTDGQGVDRSAHLRVTVTGSGQGDAGDNIFLLTGPGTSASGYDGADSYYVDNVHDRVVEAAGAGSDTVLTSVSYTLAAGQEIETLRTTNDTGTAAINLTGNEIANTLVGNAGANTLNGGAGADQLYGRDGDDIYVVDNIGDRVFEAARGGADTVVTSLTYALLAGQEIETLRTVNEVGTEVIDLSGNEFVNKLVGNAGANTLNGGAGADLLYGRGGDDSYIVDNVGDRVIEATNGGSDRVLTSVSYALLPGQEIETLRTTNDGGTQAIDLTGNDLVNKLVGNDGANVLDGGAGADTLYGRGGNDSYIIDHAGDRVVEAVDGGIDTVLTSVSYALLPGQEIETLRTTNNAGTAAINLTGNNFVNKLVGNDGANVLNGGGGADQLYGRAGADTYIVDNAGDRVFEAAGDGADTVQTSVSYMLTAGQEIETLRTVSEAGIQTIDLTGNELANRLVGNAGANILDGGAGADFLYGRGGSDTFVFSSALGPNNVDRLADFSAADDTIQLARAVFNGLAAEQLGEAAFKDLGNLGAVVDANDRILYNHNTGALSYDADGSGAASTAIQFAVISTKETLTHLDFLVA